MNKKFLREVENNEKYGISKKNIERNQLCVYILSIIRD